MNRPSSTITAAGGYGFLGVILLGIISAVWPDVYARLVIVPGFTEGLAVAIAVIAGRLKKENVLRARWGDEQISQQSGV